jgi:predicted Zn-dependent peptidase
MKKEFKSLDLVYYEEKLDNGLDVYVIPDNTKDDVLIRYVVDFGGKDNTFVPYNGKAMTEYPKGIAHFLEHKMFEQRSGESVHEFCEKNGISNRNASTSSNYTQYYFLVHDNYYKNIEYLLDYVDDLYVTEENVEKEKGIILSEALNTKDDIATARYYARASMIFKDNRAFSVIGSPEDIQSITREELVECHKTFYSPNNMAVIISGNVDSLETIKTIKNNQLKKNRDTFEIKRKEYKQYKGIDKYKYLEWDVETPITQVIYKINDEKLSYLEKIKNDLYYDIYLFFTVGSGTDLSREMNEKNMTIGSITDFLVIVVIVFIFVPLD